MNALLLPGNSSRHGEWVENLRFAMAAHFQSTETQHYRHWHTDEENADIEYEIGVAQSKMSGLEPCIIIAKSIGAAISLKGAADGRLKPEKLILLGVPINGTVPGELFAKWLGEISLPIVIVQNTGDPLGSFADVRALFADKGDNISFLELPGETHDYLDFEAISKLI